MEQKSISKSLNILFAVNEIFPDEYGGVHTYIHEVSKRFSARGHHVTILARKVREDSFEEEVIDGVNVYRYSSSVARVAFMRQICTLLNIYKMFNRISENNSFDLINFHSPHAAFAVNLSRKARIIPKIYTFYALLDREESIYSNKMRYQWREWRRYVKPLWMPLYLFFCRWIERRGLSSAEKIISLSKFTTQELERVHRVSEKKIEQIPCGVDTERFNPCDDRGAIKEKLKLPRERPILFTVRRLVPRMGLENLLEAMPKILREVPEVVLLIGGQGPLMKDLQILVKELNISSSVHLLGFIKDEDLSLYYQASDFFILPTRELEGFGIVTIEALASGLPVLGTPVGSTVEILNNLDGELLFRDSSSDSISTLIIRHLLDSSKRAIFSERCRKFVLDNYSWKDSMDRLEKVYLDVSEIK